jgi:hypothetical protein
MRSFGGGDGGTGAEVMSESVGLTHWPFAARQQVDAVMSAPNIKHHTSHVEDLLGPSMGGVILLGRNN